MPFINETIRATSPKLLNFYQCNKIVKGKAKNVIKYLLGPIIRRFGGGNSFLPQGFLFF